MQIDIDFEVFKALTALRKSETDSYNAVLRRLLELPELTSNDRPIENALLQAALRQGNALAEFATGTSRPKPSPFHALAPTLDGVWFGNSHFPNGTQFRATYKGRTYTAQIRSGQWIDSDGVARNSPSEAASAISGTNVNGWRFWFARRPGDPEWYRMDAFKQ